MRRIAGFIAAVWLLSVSHPSADGSTPLEENRVDARLTTAIDVIIETNVGEGTCTVETMEILTEGLLTFIPRPEISICFCGSYLLEGDEGFDSYYLVSEKIDLSPFVYKKVRVVGHAFSAICQGTLALPCDYLSVRKIKGLSAWGDSSSTWGSIKAIYR